MDANNRNHWFLDPGALSTWIEQFAADLAAQRYTPLTIEATRPRLVISRLGLVAQVSRSTSSMTMSFVGLPNIGVDVLVGGNGCVSHQNIRAAPGGSLFSCKGQVSHVHP
ncbi:hypothetical protein GOC82_27635 [Sinorhizobium medicae]|nr:hypothetical protein [Sinorhizobium medicae]